MYSGDRIGLAGMIIWHIVHVYPPEHGPTGVNAQESAEDFARMGHQVTVITGWPNHPTGVLYDGWKVQVPGISRTKEGFRLVRVWHSLHPKSMFWRMCYYFTFAASSLVYGLFLGPADVILCESTPIFGPLAAWLLARIKRARLVYKIHDLYPEAVYNAGLISRGLVYRLVRTLDSFVCRRADKVLTLTEGMRQMLLARPLRADHVLISRHWVDGGKIHPADRDNAWRRQQGIGLDKTVILHAGTIGFISGAQVVIRAAAKLKHRQDLLWLFVGGGPLLEPCRQLAAELGVSNARFEPFQPASVLCDVQATGDIGLVTLLERTGDSSIPSKMHGYTAAGRPVIASVAANCPTAEIVEEGRLGLVTPAEDADKLAEAVDRLSSDPQQMRVMGENARRSFLEMFDRQTQTVRLEQLLRACVGGRRSKPDRCK